MGAPDLVSRSTSAAARHQGHEMSPVERKYQECNLMWPKHLGGLENDDIVFVC
jgi:hypothetical protein